MSAYNQLSLTDYDIVLMNKKDGDPYGNHAGKDLWLWLPVQALEIGDIVVSVMTADCQAKEQNHSLSNELLWLVSHGLMHLLGWDHPNSDRLKEMLNYQEQLLCINGNL